VSPGCDLCYAERVALRFPNTFPNGFDLTLKEHLVDLPKKWKAPRIVFVNSMSDLFHRDVPDAYIQRVFKVMVDCPQHTFQVLTKRAERLARLAPKLPWPSNVWMGVSIESNSFAWRADYLRTIPATVRFISAEPLLGSLSALSLTGIHWLIAGGESQSGARPANIEWFRELRRACEESNTKFFLKQLGGHPSKRGGTAAILDGRLWHELPEKIEEASGLRRGPVQERLAEKVQPARVLRRKYRPIHRLPA